MATISNLIAEWQRLQFRMYLHFPRRKFLDAFPDSSFEKAVLDLQKRKPFYFTKYAGTFIVFLNTKYTGFIMTIILLTMWRPLQKLQHENLDKKGDFDNIFFFHKISKYKVALPARWNKKFAHVACYNYHPFNSTVVNTVCVCIYI